MSESAGTVDRWRYAVVLANVVVHFLQPGMTKSLSVLIPSLIFQLDLDYTTVGFLVPLQYSILYLACPISNSLSTKFGPRPVATLSGFLSGLSLMGAFFSHSAVSLGFSFFFAGLFSSPSRQISNNILHQHFGEKYGTAATFAHIGSQIGGMLLPFITVLSLNAYGIRGSLLCLSGILFFQTAVGATLRAPRQYTAARKKCKPQSMDDDDLTLIQSEKTDDNVVQNTEIGTQSGKDMESVGQPSCYDCRALSSNNETRAETFDSKSKWTSIVDFVSSIIDVGFLKNDLVFTFLFLPCQFLGVVSYAIWLTFSVSYGVSVGLPQNRAAYLPMAGSFGGFVGRILLVGILYKFPNLSLLTYPGCLGIASVALFMSLISSSLLNLLLCSFLAGVGFYSGFSSYYAALSLKVEGASFPMATALTCLLSGVIFLISGTAAGFLYELLGSFKFIFLITGVIVAIPCLAFSSYLYINSRLQKRS